MRTSVRMISKDGHHTSARTVCVVGVISTANSKTERLHILLTASRNRHHLTLEIRCSKIVSDAIFQPKQSRSSYISCRVMNPIFGGPYILLLSQLKIKFSITEGTSVGKTAGGATDGEIVHSYLASC